MSWQSYVDEHLMCDVEGHHLTSAAIIGQDGSVWAQSAAFPQLKPEEVTNIMNDFNEPGTLAPVGLFLGSTKYMVIQGEPGSVIRGKKGIFLLPLGAGGVTVKKTNQALIFGLYDEPILQANATWSSRGWVTTSSNKVCRCALEVQGSLLQMNCCSFLHSAILALRP